MRQLLQASPLAALLTDHMNRTPVELALSMMALNPQAPFDKMHLTRAIIARRLLTHAPLRTQDKERLLARIASVASRLSAGSAAPLYAILASRLPFKAAEWALVPSPCPGIGAALPAVLHRSEAEAALLVARLPAAERRRMRTLALCIGAGARRGLLPPLPSVIAQRLLAEFAALHGPQQLLAEP